jgi:hypothetical protein
MRRKCTKAGCGNNSTGHETLERRLVQLLVIARDIQSVLPDHVGALPNDVPKLYKLHVVPTRQVSGRETCFEL